MKREGWYMSDEEIVKEYNHAANRKMQIKIIADQNCKTVKEVKEILIEKGALVEKKASEKLQEKIDNSLVVELVREEMCDKYCKYSDLLARASNEQEWVDFLHSICEKCPLNRLG